MQRRAMANTSCDDALSEISEALSYLEWIEEKCQLNFSVENKIWSLKLELISVRTFLVFKTDSCINYENWQDLMTSIRELSDKVLDVLDWFHIYPYGKEEREFHDMAINVLVQINLLKPVAREVYMIDSKSSTSHTRLSKDLLVEYIDALQKQMMVLPSGKADVIAPVKKEIEALGRKLNYIQNVLRCTRTRSIKSKKRKDLLARIQSVVDHAAYFSCLDENISHSRMTLELSELFQMIDYIGLEIYVVARKASKSSMLRTSMTNETAVEFVNCIVDGMLELLQRKESLMNPWKGQTGILYEELNVLRYFLMDQPEEFAEPEKMNDLLTCIRLMVLEEAPRMFYSFSDSAMNEDMAKEMNHLVPELLEKMCLIKPQVREIYLKVPKLPPSNFPKTDELGSFDFLLANLKEFLSYGANSIPLLKHHIEAVLEQLEFLRDFLNKISKQRNEYGELKELWTRIIEVACEMEYVIDSVAVRNCPIWHRMLWFSDVREEIELMRTKVIAIFDNNIYDVGDHNVGMASNHVTSEANSPTLDEETVGYEDQELQLIEHLIKPAAELDFLSIVGMPGLGKTTLAKKVYNNPIITDHFYVRSWCCVSQVYRKKELLIDILNHIMVINDKESNMSEDELAELLYKCLKGQRYLIVADDVWDNRPWDSLRRCFPNDKNGSRIMVTSRFHDLCWISSGKIHQLRQFTDDESWELLRNKLFPREGCPLELLETGKRIAKSCKGLPLAVVVAAGLLRWKDTEQDRYKQVVDQWREVAKYLSSDIVNDSQRRCMDILEFSYNNLPDFLKPCFLYIGAFPTGNEIPVSKLIRLWVAEGFVKNTEQKSLENIAEGYLTDLIRRSLIIVAETRSLGGIKACCVHDLIRDFCLAKAKEEKFFQLVNGERESDYLTSSDFSKLFVDLSLPNKYPDHLPSMYLERPEFNKPWPSGQCARSLLFFAPGSVLNNKYSISFIFHSFKLLRVLDLECFNNRIVLPDEIDLLAHLRYLAGYFQSVPSSVANLRNLETFRLKANISLASLLHFTINLPHTILNMVKLRHLHIDPYTFFSQKCSDDFSHLANLQTISNPVLSYGDHGEKAMRRFPNLRKLRCIFWGRWESSATYRFPVLDFLNRLETLKVFYEGNSFSLSSFRPFEFSFPNNLKKLTMSNFRLPWWEISIIGKLPNLEVLKLHSDAFTGAEWNTEDGEFLKLKYLKLEYLDIFEWNAWGDHFPHLERLVIRHCAYLDEIPSCIGDISTLKMIEVSWCSVSLKNSVRQIKEEQVDMGNEELKVLFK